VGAVSTEQNLPNHHPRLCFFPFCFLSLIWPTGTSSIKFGQMNANLSDIHKPTTFPLGLSGVLEAVVFDAAGLGLLEVDPGGGGALKDSSSSESSINSRDYFQHATAH
jgi:hypothetical protein